MKEKINLRQMGCLAGILIFANKILILPSLLFEKSNVDGIFVLFFFFVVELGLLAIFFKIKSIYKTETFFDILSKFLTKYGAYIVYALFCMFFIIRALLTFNVSLMYLKNQVYFEMGEYVFLLCFLSISNNLVFKGTRAIGRTTEFFYIILIFFSLICIYATSFNFAGLPILFKTSFSTLAETSFSYIFWFGDLIFFFLIMDKIDYKKEKVKTVYFYVIINMLIVTFVHVLFISLFKYTGFMHNNAASDVITHSNRFSGLGRIDILAVIIVMILTYSQLSAYNLAFETSFNQIFRKKDKIYSVVIYDLCFVIVLYLFLNDFTKAVQFATGFMPYVAMFLQYVLPLACLIFCLFKRRKNEYQKDFRHD